MKYPHIIHHDIKYHKIIVRHVTQASNRLRRALSFFAHLFFYFCWLNILSQHISNLTSSKYIFRQNTPEDKTLLPHAPVSAIAPCQHVLAKSIPQIYCSGM